MNCPQCGVEVATEAGFCHKCGANLGEDAPLASAPAGATAAERFQQAATQRQGADAGDQNIWEGSYSPKAMVGAWVVLGIITAVGIAVCVFFPAAILAVGIAVPALWVLQIAYLVYRRMAVHYQLTNHWFLHERGVLSRQSDRIEVIDMDDVTVVQGFIERMLGVGTIKITSSDRTHPVIVLPGIDEVRKVAGRLDELRRAERMRRGLHIESI
jgi:membrane protein YdbS with pleckstrin-like domain